MSPLPGFNLDGESEDLLGFVRWCLFICGTGGEAMEMSKV